MPSLYEMSKDLKELEELIELNGEITEEGKAILDSIEGSFNDKIESTAKLLNWWESQKVTIDNEIKRLQELKKVKGNSIQRVKDFMLESMINADKKKIDTGLFKVTVRLNPEKVEIVNDMDIDAEFLKVEEITSIDKKGLKLRYKETGEVPSGVRITRSQSLMIK